MNKGGKDMRKHNDWYKPSKVNNLFNIHNPTNAFSPFNTKILANPFNINNPANPGSLGIAVENTCSLISFSASQSHLLEAPHGGLGLKTGRTHLCSPDAVDPDLLQRQILKNLEGIMTG